MRKYGKKIVAVMIAAMCCISTLPLFVNAAFEEIYHPAVVTITNGYRYSFSSGSFVEAPDRACITIPFETNNGSVTLEFNQVILFNATLYYIDENYMPVGQIYKTPGNLTYTVTGITLSKGYLIINDDQSGTTFPSDLTLSVNGSLTTVISASYTEARFAFYETIEIPDDDDNNGIVGKILNMWSHILSDNLSKLDEFYTELTQPIALILGVPAIIALISLLFKFLGGKFK